MVSLSNPRLERGEYGQDILGNIGDKLFHWSGFDPNLIVAWGRRESHSSDLLG
jgi:hypothetical protein